MIANTRNISDFLHHAFTINVDASLHTLLTTLNWDEKSSIVVMTLDDKVFGIITAVDINKAREQKLNFDSTKVWEICTQKVKSVTPDTNLEDALEIMQKNKMHHLIVIQDNQVDGVVILDEIQAGIDNSP